MKALVVATLADRGQFLADLAACCDVVVAADGGASACFKAGVTPNVVVGDLDSLEGDAETRLREAGVSFLVFPAVKDVTDLDLALDVVRREGAREVWVTGAFGGRIDHTLATIGSLARNADLSPSVREPGSSGWILAEADRRVVELQGAGASVSIFALTSSATISCRGMKYPLDHEVLGSLDSRGLSNQIEAAEAAIEAHAGTVLVLTLATNGTVLARERANGPLAE